MKYRGSVLVIFLPFILNACATVRNEMHHSGGASGAVLDKHLLNASGSKQLQVMRAALVVAMVARAGAVNTFKGEQGSAFVSSLVDTVDEINFLAGYVYGPEGGPVSRPYGCRLGPAPHMPGTVASADDLSAAVGEAREAAQSAHDAAMAAINAARSASSSASTAIDAERAVLFAAAGGAQPLPVAPEPPPTAERRPRKPEPACFNYDVNFEADIPLMEESVLHLALLSMPQEQMRRFLESLKPGNILMAAWNGAKLVLQASYQLHNAAAVHRTAIEVIATQMEDRACPGEAPKDGRRDTVTEAFACLGYAPGSVFRAPPSTVTFKPEVPAETFNAIMQNIYDSCMMAPVALNLENSDMKISDAWVERAKVCGRIKFDPRPRNEKVWQLTR